MPVTGAREVGSYFAVLDAIVDIGQNPVFDVMVHGLAAMHQGHMRTVPP